MTFLDILRSVRGLEPTTELMKKRALDHVPDARPAPWILTFRIFTWLRYMTRRYTEQDTMYDLEDFQLKAILVSTFGFYNWTCFVQKIACYWTITVIMDIGTIGYLILANRNWMLRKFIATVDLGTANLKMVGEMYGTLNAGLVQLATKQVGKLDRIREEIQSRIAHDSALVHDLLIDCGLVQIPEKIKSTVARIGDITKEETREWLRQCGVIESLIDEATMQRMRPEDVYKLGEAEMQRPCRHRSDDAKVLEATDQDKIHFYGKAKDALRRRFRELPLEPTLDEYREFTQRYTQESCRCKQMKWSKLVQAWDTVIKEKKKREEIIGILPGSVPGISLITASGKYLLEFRGQRYSCQDTYQVARLLWLLGDSKPNPNNFMLQQ